MADQRSPVATPAAGLSAGSWRRVGKRVASVLAAGALALVAVGCGGGSSAGVPTDAPMAADAASLPDACVGAHRAWAASTPGDPERDTLIYCDTRRQWEAAADAAFPSAPRASLAELCADESVAMFDLCKEASGSAGDQPSAAKSPTSPVQVRGEFTGSFTSSDGLQICRATRVDVGCISTPSGQEVWLGAVGANYIGTGGAGLEVSSASSLSRPVTTPSGITCEATGRGIECLRGGHGFVIGDSRVIVLRGPQRETFDAVDPSDLAPPVVDAPVDEYVADLGLTCDDFLTQPVAQASLDRMSALAPSLDPDGDGLACTSLPSSLDIEQPRYVGVDLSDESVGAVSPSGFWAETCPGGSCRGAASSANGLPRDTYVAPYVRSDGTYVGAHYRSSP